MSDNIDRIELDIMEMKEIIAKRQVKSKKYLSDLNENELKDYNIKLKNKAEFLHKRERELLEKVMILKSYK